MRIILFGAAGNVGSRIANEALSRGHTVTAVVRKTDQLATLSEGVLGQLGDAGDSALVAKLSEGQDLIISAIRPSEGSEHLLPLLTKSLLAGAAQANKRLLIVGGAASLEIPGEKGQTVLTAPGFLPPSVLDIARACAEQHNICRENTETNWTYISPPPMLTPGIRTGQYRLGSDQLVVDENGQSAISMEDFAVALIDEAEQPKHHQTRFTAAY
ncbi:MAG: NAD(P)H-binding protein [Sneathiella sp.]